MAADLELFEAWCGGDSRAGSELFDLHAKSLYWFFRNKVGETAAEDLVQETFLACLSNRETFRKEASFRTYLFTAARSRLYNYLTRDKRKADRIDFGVTSVQDLGASPSAFVVQKQRDRMLLEALRHIPLDYQIAIELYYFEQIRGPELASVLDIPEGTLRTRLRRGRQLLQEKLLELGVSKDRLESTIGSLESWAKELREQASGKSGD